MCLGRLLWGLQYFGLEEIRLRKCDVMEMRLQLVSNFFVGSVVLNARVDCSWSLSTHQLWVLRCC